MSEQGDAEQVVRLVLHHIGEDVTRPGLIETPRRVVDSWKELFSGYKQDPMDHMKVFEGEQYDEMVLVKNIEFFSCCEHHMQPFFGMAHVAYIPNGKVIGLSKVARVVDVFARRLQVQERLTVQVREALDKGLTPGGVAVAMEAKHFCMVCRGVGKQNSTTLTTSFCGAFKSDPATRAEFMSLITK